MNRVALSATWMLALSACSGLPTERQLVGTWTSPESTTENEFGVTQSRSKQMVDATFGADHTYVWRLRGHKPTAIGRWSLSGRYIVTEFTTRGHGRRIPHQYRDKITKLTEHELIFPEGTWAKVR